MNIFIVCFTYQGVRLCKMLSEKVQGHHLRMACAKKDAGLEYIDSLKEWTKSAFQTANAIVFVGASGIAVRSIAPFIKDKANDPAVLVMDEGGRFVISLLSGHLGGANALAGEIAHFIGAQPIITTATDQYDLLAVDSFSKKNGLKICDMNMAKQVSAALLEGKRVGFFSQFPFFHLPNEFENMNQGKKSRTWKQPDIGVVISVYQNQKLYRNTLLLVPKVLHLGIGCKKNTSAQTIDELCTYGLLQSGISPHAIKSVATIHIKASEKGLLEFCKNRNIFLQTYTVKELQDVIGDFSSSAFVMAQTGVDNVCERAAVLAAGEGGRLILGKTAKNGVTLAIAIENWGVDFAE